MVSALVAGEEVWFSSKDAVLSAAPEAFLSAFLIPAQLRKDRLVSNSPVCGTWFRNTHELSVITNGWWKRKVKPPEVPIVDRGKPKRWWRKTALFFTAGVDSFHTLNHYPKKIHALVNIHGFDIALANESRQKPAEQSYRSVARQKGISLVQIQTNLREHSYFNKTNWDYTHGGAMAAVAHLLKSDFHDFVLSSSTRRNDTRIWGSTWQIDHLWSSGNTRFISWGEHLSRAEKMEQIAGNSLVQEHLRVCWASTGPAANCGTCPKCTRTMVSLLWAGRFEQLKHCFVENPPLLDVISNWKPAPIWSTAELDPVYTNPERLPEPLRSAIRSQRDQLLADLDLRLRKKSRSDLYHEIPPSPGLSQIRSEPEMPVGNR